MANFIEQIAKLDELKEFEGGNDKQREHLNTLVRVINAIIKAAKGDDQKLLKLLEGMSLVVVYVPENAAISTYQIAAKKIEEIQP